MMPKSLPLCFEGDFNNLSTFSSKTNGGLLTSNMSLICHQRTPFLPCIPFSFDKDLATE